MKLDFQRPATDEDLARFPFSVRQRYLAQKHKPLLEDLLDLYGHLVPATTQTFEALTRDLRSYYRDSKITETAARALLAESMRTQRGGEKSCFAKKSPTSAKGRPRLNDQRAFRYGWGEKAG